MSTSDEAALAAAAAPSGPSAEEDERAVAAAAAAAYPLAGADADLDPLLAAIGDAQLVLLGESTHGSTEFYEVRAAITRRLVAERGFTVVLCEADWPAAHRLNRYVGCEGSMDRSAAEALGGFEAFPRWMWRNAPFARLAEALREHNERVQRGGDDQRAMLAALHEMRAAGATEEQMRAAGLDVQAVEAFEAGGRPVSVYGMDVYAVRESARSVVEFLDIVDPDAAEAARSHYAVFDAFDGDMKAYGHQVMPGGELAELAGTIQASLLSTLTELQRQNREAYALMLSPSELLNAEQCAQVVVNGESYFRELYTHTAVDTWNLRDQHFVQTALRLREYHTAASGAPPKMVFWAHNSHVGDARATELGSRRQEWNLGQMIRSTFGTNNTFVCGFGTHGGTVTAASEWGEEAKTFELNPAQKGSYSELFHRALPSVRSRVDVDADALNAFLLLLRSDAPDADERERAATAAFATNRRQRAIGVCYKKEQESLSHYFEANLSSQCDAWIHVDNTNALVPLAVP